MATITELKKQLAAYPDDAECSAKVNVQIGARSSTLTMRKRTKAEIEAARG